MSKRLDLRKGDLSRIMKKGGSTAQLMAMFHRFLLDGDLTEEEKQRYERSLRFLTSKASMGEAPEKKENDPFA